MGPGAPGPDRNGGRANTRVPRPVDVRPLMADESMGESAQFARLLSGCVKVTTGWEPWDCWRSLRRVVQ